MAVQVQIIIFYLCRIYLSWYAGDLTNKGDHGVALLNIICRGITFLWQKVSFWKHLGGTFNKLRCAFRNNTRKPTFL